MSSSFLHLLVRHSPRCLPRSRGSLSRLSSQWASSARTEEGPGQSQQTHFGFETVTEDQKASKVQHVFDSVASNYDLMNDAMSAGLHRVWKDELIRTLDPSPNTQLLDVAGGTGDVAFRFLDAIKSNRHPRSPPTSVGQVVVCDVNPSMLEVGRRRAEERGAEDAGLVSWREGDAMRLPFEDGQFDAYTIAFGIRNVVRIGEALSEAHRVLRPGGRFLCLEFSKVENPLVAAAYDLYSFQVIPPLGKVLAGDWHSYQYLVESIRQFPAQEDFAKMICASGFRAVTHRNLTLGVVAIHSGFKL